MKIAITRLYDDLFNTDDPLVRCTLAQDTREALLDLINDQRGKAIYMASAAGYTIDEIGDAMRLSKSTVSQLALDYRAHHSLPVPRRGYGSVMPITDFIDCPDALVAFD